MVHQRRCDQLLESHTSASFHDASGNDLTLTALALNLDQNREISRGLAIPGLERLQLLKTVTLRVDCNLYAHTVLRRGLEGVLARVVSTWRKLESGRVRELERFAISTGKSIRERVERQIASENESSDDIRRSNESVSCRICIITPSEITVVGCDD